MLKLNYWIASLLMLMTHSAINAQQSYNHVEQFRSKGNVQLSNELKRAFRIDAARLSMRMKDDLSNQAIEIPREQMNFFYNLLLNVYEKGAIAKDIANCGIHTATAPSADYIELIFDRNASWAIPLRDGVTSTNSSIINKLTEQYDLIIESYQQLDYQRDMLIIRAVEPINMAALANRLYDVKEIKQINLESDKKINSDIIVTPMDDGWKVTYLLRFQEENIPQQHSWIYYAYRSGRVEFITESGAPIPDYLSCK